MIDFANILLSGPCNACCPTCIGRQIDPRLNVDNLNRFPPINLAPFLDLVRRHRVRRVVLTGTDTDPQLYHHEGRLLAHLRAALPADTRISLHTNGRLALQRSELLNRYDQVCISLPSFEAETYRRLMGVSGVPDLAEILRRVSVPIKLSCLVTDLNAGEIAGYLAGCSDLGVRRLVLRKLYGDERPWENLLQPERLELRLVTTYRNNPVYAYQRGAGAEAIEVTLWDFGQTESRSLNLYSSGLISDSYLLAQAHCRLEQLPTGQAVTSRECGEIGAGRPGARRWFLARGSSRSR